MYTSTRAKLTVRPATPYDVGTPERRNRWSRAVTGQVWQHAAAKAVGWSLEQLGAAAVDAAMGVDEE